MQLALFQAAIPVGLASFVMVWWALKQGYLEQKDDIGSVRLAVRKMAKRRKGEKVSYNPVHDKWLSLGGGFYGIAGLLTYVLVEWRDVSGIVLDLGGLTEFIQQFDIGVVVNIFVESLLNFITAVTWPLYWLSHIDSEYAWIWIVAAYVGYWIGLKGAHMTIESTHGRSSDANPDKPD
jgi:hypothetical protein